MSSFSIWHWLALGLALGICTLLRRRGAAARALWDSVAAAIVGTGGLAGAITGVVVVGGACLAAGPIGWLVGLYVVPAAAALGFALGASGFLIAAPLLLIAVVLTAL